jgi:esterase/lipase superfamily enzyme
VRVFSINSINKYAWMDESVPVREAARRQALFSGYVEEEVIPHIRRVCGDPNQRVAATGASFGAFHAANQVLRRPDLFDTLVAMSGFYDLESGYTRGIRNDDIYFNNPVSYIGSMGEGPTLDRLRHDTKLHIVSGRGAYEAPHRSEQLSQVLWSKGIPNELDMWGHDVNHDWPWWRKMLPHYVENKLGW